MKPEKNLGGRLISWLAVGFGGLSLCGCMISSPVDWRCFDKKGNPLPGVFATYYFHGYTWISSYSRPGGYVISDKNGVLHFPFDKIHPPSLTDSPGELEIATLYSDKTHSTFRDGSISTIFSPGPLIDGDRQSRQLTFVDRSEDPIGWYLALISLIGNCNTDDTSELSLARLSIAKRERTAFLTRYGSTCPPLNFQPRDEGSEPFKEADDYATAHHIPRTEVAFEKLLNEFVKERRENGQVLNF